MTERDDYDDYDDDSDCANCGGTGYVANCYSDYACVDPEEGCDQCMRRCDWCNPPKLTPKEQAQRDALRQVLAEALSKPDHTP